MRVKRSSLYVNLTDEPITTVVRDRDVRMPLEEIRPEEGQTGNYVHTDIFEMGAGSIEQATMQALERMQANRQREHDAALLYFYNASRFPTLNDGGTLFQTKRSPLSVQEVKAVFHQLADHPGYRKFHLHALCEDGRSVNMHDGIFKVTFMQARGEAADG